MKQFVSGSDEMDLILFEYLEGELSEEQAKELETRLATDPSLQMELELWKESFITPETPNTESLEKQLVKPEIQHTQPSTTSVTIALFSFFLSILPLTTQKQTLLVSNTVFFPQSHSLLGRKESIREKNELVVEKELPSPKRTFPPQRKEPPLLLKKIETYQPLQPKVLLLEVNPAADNLKLRRVRLATIRVPAVVKALTRKQKRAVVRMKEKALQQRRASKFLKGRAPYVVPLNTENF